MHHVNATSNHKEASGSFILCIIPLFPVTTNTDNVLTVVQKLYEKPWHVPRESIISKDMKRERECWHFLKDSKSQGGLAKAVLRVNET